MAASTCLGKTDDRAGYPILRRASFATAGLIVILIFSLSFPSTFEYPIPDYRFRSIECFSKGQFTCSSPELIDRADIIKAIRSLTPSDSSLISIPPTELGGPIRFEALRSEAYDPLDTIRLVLGNVSNAIILAEVIWNGSKLLSFLQICSSTRILILQNL